MAFRRSAPPTDLRSIPDTGGAIIPGSERMPPPPELREVEKKIWNDITGRLPAEWFTADNAPMLKELCRHIAFSDELTVAMEVERTKIETVTASLEPDNVKIKKVNKATKALHSLLRLHGYQSERIGNLATKLRLTNQSRWQPFKAEEQRTRAAAGPKPWDAWH